MRNKPLSPCNRLFMVGCLESGRGFDYFETVKTNAQGATLILSSKYSILDIL